MATDEALFSIADRPVLRVYCWSELTISIGYFEPFDSAQGAKIPVVRRWTGGGTVLHGGTTDVTYSLVAPRGHPVARMRPLETYRRIHGAVGAALRGSGIDAGFALASSGAADSPGGACFSNPVMFDLVDGSGAKLAGAGQRRSRLGLLHQGSIHVPVQKDWREPFARSLAVRWEVVPATRLRGKIAPRMRELTASRYGAPGWLERVTAGDRAP